ncbi:MAG: HDOD domain-containing protein [Verrucomicrobiales bacterium]|nr:HDOD domain-containing protein [Verrucomicrobiales bacterium]
MGLATMDTEELIRKVGELAPLPASTVRLTQVVTDSGCSIEDVIEVILFDQALTLKLLKAANSASSGSAEPISDARFAVCRLGTAQVLTLAVASGAKSHLQARLAAYGLEEGALWRHSVAAAVGAEVIPRFCGVELPPETFTAALLHDVGKLVLSRFASPEVARELAETRDEPSEVRLEAERNLLGTDHADLGGRVASHWSLPPRVIKGIVHHHEPQYGRDPICDATYLANHIAKSIEAGLDGKSFDEAPDPCVLARLQFKDRDLDRLWTVAVSRYAQVKLHYQAV